MSTLHEHNNNNATAIQSVYNNGGNLNYGGMAFTAGSSYSFTETRFWVFRAGTATTADYIVYLYRTDANHKPTGSVLASGSINTSNFTTNSTGAEYAVTWSTPYTLTNGLEYICVHTCDIVVANRPLMKGATSGSGFCYTSDGGSTWTTVGYVSYFQNYGNDSPGSAIKTINGLAKASVKTINGLAIESVKTWNGLA